MRTPDPKVEVASGEFDRRKANGLRQPGIAHIGRLFKLRPRQLANYRANYISRKERERRHRFDLLLQGLELAAQRRIARLVQALFPFKLFCS
jgi:hypothetical protein